VRIGSSGRQTAWECSGHAVVPQRAKKGKIDVFSIWVGHGSKGVDDGGWFIKRGGGRSREAGRWRVFPLRRGAGKNLASGWEAPQMRGCLSSEFVE